MLCWCNRLITFIETCSLLLNVSETTDNTLCCTEHCNRKQMSHSQKAAAVMSRRIRDSAPLDCISFT
jgi:hypothetical protein